MVTKKRAWSFAFAALVCCIALFVVGIGFGAKQRNPRNIGNNKGPLFDRVRVIPPKFGHAPVRPETVATAKEVLRTLPPQVYNLLEKNGASINLAPNIEDNWPGSGDGARPGATDMTMGEENGRCYGRDVWLYEAEKVRGSQELKAPRSQQQMENGLYQLLGHSINDCMGVVTNQAELAKAYSEDIDKMSATARIFHIEEVGRTEASRAMGCSEIIGVLIGKERDTITNDFPRTTAYLKKVLIIE